MIQITSNLETIQNKSVQRTMQRIFKTVIKKAANSLRLSIVLSHHMHKN